MVSVVSLLFMLFATLLAFVWQWILGISLAVLVASWAVIVFLYFWCTECSLLRNSVCVFVNLTFWEGARVYLRQQSEI